MTARIILDQVLNETGCLALFNGSRMAMEISLHAKLEVERTHVRKRELNRILGVINSKRLLHSGNTKEEEAVRRVLDGLVHELGREP